MGAEKAVGNVRQKLRRNAFPIVMDMYNSFSSVCLTFNLYFRKITLSPAAMYASIFFLIFGRTAAASFVPSTPVIKSFCVSITIGAFINNLRYFIFMSVGNFTAIVVPFSELSSTRTSPPCSATISHTSESPNPTPPFSLFLDLSTRKKG